MNDLTKNTRKRRARPTQDDTLHHWPDNFYEQANPLTRSSVFSCSKTREHFDDYTPVRVVGDGEILYRGYKLNTSDEDVFLQLLQYIRGRSLSRWLFLDRAQLLKDLDWGEGGTAYDRLEASLNRLDSAKMKITSPAALRKLYTLLKQPELLKSMNPKYAADFAEDATLLKDGIKMALDTGTSFFVTVGFIQNNSATPKGQLWLRVDPLNTLLWDGVNTTRISRHERSQLSPAEKKLHAFILSHSGGVYNLSVETYRDLIGSKTANLRHLKRQLRVWFGSLEKLQRIEPGWNITDDNKVTGVKPIPYD